MNKQELYDYIMKSPYNTNPVILRQEIEGLSNNSDGGNGGTSPSGGKIAIFDLAKYDEYEKIELGPLQTMIKLSDEVPTYDELAAVCTYIVQV